MKTFDEKFDSFEESVIRKMLEGPGEFLQVLRKQYSVAIVKKREYTVHGFYTYYSIPAEIERLDVQDFQLGNVGAKIDGLKYDAGFLLYVKEGKIDCLEGYTYDEIFPLQIEKFELYDLK
jgi:hypothetical protein